MKILLWVLCLVLLCSCSLQSTSDTSEITAPRDTVEIKGLGLVLDGYCPYRVVRPEEASDEIIAAAKSIDTYLFYRLDTHIEIKNDFAKETELEILVGNTNRKETKDVLSTLKDGQYTVRQVGKKIVLVGTDDKGTAEAVDWFVRQFIKSAEKKDEEPIYLDVVIEKEMIAG